MAEEVTAMSQCKDVLAEICQRVDIDFLSLNIDVISPNIWFITRFSWPYLEALRFQEACVDVVYQNPEITIFIATNHPACLTLGRGLQRKVGDTTELVDFNNWQREHVDIPIYDIKRGGGVTFHHPGQLVIYPIVNLTRKKIKVYTLMGNLLREISHCLSEVHGEMDFDFCRDLLGLWAGQYKVASIGLQVRRFVTFHGVALNIFGNDDVEKALQNVYPCGLPGSVYQNIENLYHAKLGQMDIVEVLEKLKKRTYHLLLEKQTCP